MKITKLNEDYLDSAEYRIQRYEDEITEILPKLHDQYMTGMINANFYAEVLKNVYNALYDALPEEEIEEQLITSVSNDVEEESVPELPVHEEYDDNFDDVSVFDDTGDARISSLLFTGKTNMEESKSSTKLSDIKDELATELNKRHLKINSEKNSLEAAAEYISQGGSNYSVAQWIDDTLQNYPTHLLKESHNKIRRGDIVVHVDDNPPTRGVVVEINDDIAVVQVGDPLNRDYVDVPVNKLQLDESFRYRLDLEDIEWKIASLLDVDSLGEDNWIEYSQGDVYGLMGSNEHGCPFEAIGPEDSTKRGSLRTSNGRVNVVFRNGSEASCNSVEEIARFIAGEFGLSI